MSNLYNKSQISLRLGQIAGVILNLALPDLLNLICDPTGQPSLRKKKQLKCCASEDDEDEEGAEIKRMAGRRCRIEDSNSEEDNQHVHLLGSQTPLALCASSAIPTSTYTSSSFTSLPGVDQGNKSQSSSSSKRAKATAGTHPRPPNLWPLRNLVPDLPRAPPPPPSPPPPNPPLHPRVPNPH
ncbi:hypothetical protein RHS01_01357 [Rhizoctonia solani]|uniref:Uncharacterized protein n=1 Tax=Rhizoctonia solani TaxID=456999 RepID=A0A8H7M8S7_9AGAM|nr:hypothetical protein RHS01_01357 [Rhizoctonia solani]